MDFDNIKCRTKTCDWFGIVIPTEANGTEVRCSGECQNVLRADNPDHPNYPESVEPAIPQLTDQEILLLRNLLGAEND